MRYELQVVNTATNQVFGRTDCGVVSFERASRFEENVNKSLDRSKFHTRLIQRWAPEAEKTA